MDLNISNLNNYYTYARKLLLGILEIHTYKLRINDGAYKERIVFILLFPFFI